MKTNIDTLHPLESKLLLWMEPEGTSKIGDIGKALGIEEAQARQAISWLIERGCVLTARKRVRQFFLPTEWTKEVHAHGLPERRIVDHIQKNGAMSLPAVAKALALDQASSGSAFGKLQRAGTVRLNEAREVERTGKPLPAEIEMLEKLINRSLGEELIADTLTDEEQALLLTVSKKRGAAGALFRIVERSDAEYQMTAEGKEMKDALKQAGISGEELTALTSEQLRNSSWKGKRFRSYNIHIPPSRTLLGRISPYAQFLREIKDQFVALGFEEFDGPLVETEFWNCDALYMPQFHAARGTHDVYVMEHPTHARELPEEYLQAVSEVHNNGGTSGSSGWNYAFDCAFTKRLILRSQGTALSAKQLPIARSPGRYFGIVRCFRNDQIDATHLSDFYQTEGIVIGPDVNMRTLLGLLKTFAVEFAAANEVRFTPGYFPFTEPSVEIHVRHPKLGWFELGGSGLFRPEVTAPFGIKDPVLAWGLGIDRMALMKLGLSDLRDLFTTDLESVRLQVE